MSTKKQEVPKGYEAITLKISGDALMMHNPRLADPLDRFAKELKRLAGKRKKTEADLQEIAKVEFLGGLYVNGNGPMVPSTWIEAALIGGAKKSKEGQLAKAGIVVADNVDVDYEGPRDPEKMWEDGRFADRRIVVVQRNKVMRTRPIFNDWSATFTVWYMPDIVNREQIIDYAEKAGTYCGIGTYRPKYGRFNVEVVK